MKKIKLILVILVSFYISFLLRNYVFLADSPRLRPFIAARFLKYLSGLGKKNEKNIAVQQEKTIVKSGKEGLYSISKGIYAKEVKGGKIILMKENEIVWKIYQYEIDGKKISIKVPENEQPPDKDVIKKIFNL